MGWLNNVISSNLYIFLFGSGGILAVIVAVIAIIAQRRNKRKRHGIFINESKNTRIDKNNLSRDTSIVVEKSEGTDVRDNKG
ncbi:MAG: hypothetical protein LUF30_03400 [Lachnospiraceae bacterium]|nr:hypothetical protein [Lachnospiraceae bacterium]